MDGDLFDLQRPTDVAICCAEQAEAIRVLGRSVVGDIIEIGDRLIAVKQTVLHGDWLPCSNASSDGPNMPHQYVAIQATAYRILGGNEVT
jgi:hypothetical protein